MVEWKLIQTLFVKIIMEKKLIVLNIFFLLSCIKKITTPAEGVREERSEEQRRASYCP